MAHGQPDYGMYNIASTIYRLSDMGELAVRLGSIVSFDRRGDVLFMDSFSGDKVSWGEDTQGTGASVDWCAESGQSSPFSVKLTGGSDGNRWADLRKSMDYPVASRIGFEVSFAIPGSIEEIKMTMAHHDGTIRYLASLTLDQVNQHIEIISADLPGGVIDSYTKYPGSVRQFHTMKLVFDMATNHYSRALVGNRAYDLSAYGMTTAASSQAPYIQVIAGAQSRAGVNDYIYIDNAIITQNEP